MTIGRWVLGLLPHLGSWFGACYQAIPYLATWVLTVPLLGAVPLAVHLSTVMINGHKALLGEALTSDAALYTFILAMSAVTDTVSEGARLLPIFFTIAAILAAILYAYSLETTVTHGEFFPLLQSSAKKLLGGLTVAYLCYKLRAVYILGREERNKKRGAK